MNQVELNLISVFFGSKILKICFSYVLAFLFKSFPERTGLVSLTPEGSPMEPVKSPIKKTTLCPRSWNCFNLLIKTVCVQDVNLEKWDQNQP